MRSTHLAKLYILVPIILFSGVAAFSQTTSSDSVNNKTSNKEIYLQSNRKTDSVQTAFQQRSDSLRQTYKDKLGKLDSIENALQHDNIIQKANHKVDSIQSGFYQRTDSLKNAYRGKLSKLDSIKSRLQKRVDSLTTLRLPTNRVTQKLDSLNKLRENTTASFEKKIQSFKDQTTEKLKELDLPPEVNEKVTAITKNIKGIDIPTSGLNLPSTNIASNPLGKVDGLGNVNGLPEINTNTPLQSSPLTGKTGEMKLPDATDQLKNGTENIPDASKITNQASGYTKDAEQLAKGNVNEVKQLPKTTEEKVVKASGIEGMEEQASLSKYRDMAGKAQDQEAVKKEAMEKAKSVAVDHFAGKEEQLKAAMEKISKYKQKYSSMNGVSDLSKKRPNEMRGKGWFERVLPCVAIQLQKKGEDLLVDFNPYAGYRFTRSLTAGAGWNQRVAYNLDNNIFNPNARIFGPRIFGEFKLGKGFSPRAEVEVMNTRVPPLTQAPTPDFGNRQWVWGAFAGIKKEYKLIKNVKGTAMVMIRIFNPAHKSPYADVLNVRFGFEFPMKKNIKKR